MGIDLFTYSGIITKIRALQSGLMTKDDYNRIAYLETTADFISYIKAQPGFAHIFDKYDESKLHRGQIEQILTNSVHLSYAKVYRFAGQIQRKYLSLIFFRFEVNILKACLQKVFNEEDNHDLLLFESFFESHSSLNVSTLAASQTIEEFINNLHNTPYYSLFQKLYSTHHDSLQDYEVQLDIYYFTKSWKMIEHFPKGKNRKIIKALYGTQIDLLNIQWIYRSKKFYDMSAVKIVTNIIPITYKLNKNNLDHMIEAISTEEFAREISKTYYKKIFSELDYTNIESAYVRKLMKLYSMYATKYSHSMAPVLRFLFMKELELENLTTALECIRYRLTPNEILDYLIYE